MEESAEGGGCGPDLEEWGLFVEAMFEFEDAYTFEVLSVLERVEIAGISSGCMVEVSGPWGSADADCDDLERLQLDQDVMNLEERIGLNAVFETTQELVEIVSPVLKKCIVTPPSNAIKTPDQDKDFRFMVAKDSIAAAYAGNSEVVYVGVRADVKYPNGDIVRFIVMEMNGKVVVDLARFLDGVPNKKNSPC